MFCFVVLISWWYFWLVFVWYYILVCWCTASETRWRCDWCFRTFLTLNLCYELLLWMFFLGCFLRFCVIDMFVVLLIVVFCFCVCLLSYLWLGIICSVFCSRVVSCVLWIDKIFFFWMFVFFDCFVDICCEIYIIVLCFWRCLMLLLLIFWLAGVVGSRCFFWWF